VSYQHTPKNIFQLFYIAFGISGMHNIKYMPCWSDMWGENVKFIIKVGWTTIFCRKISLSLGKRGSFIIVESDPILKIKIKK
jgi:hypothetical protein